MANSFNVLLCLVLIAMVGCSPSAIPASKPSPDPSLQPRVASKHSIVPGLGIDGCSVGDPKEDAIAMLGTPASDESGYTEYPNHGIEFASDENGRIKSLFMYYQMPDYTIFSGATKDGINAQSSVDDVLRIYGTPSRVGESTISQFGAKPGAIEKSLQYYGKGIVFTFWDGKLAYICVTRPAL